jgi:hypothetical protein
MGRLNDENWPYGGHDRVLCVAKFGPATPRGRAAREGNAIGGGRQRPANLLAGKLRRECTLAAAGRPKSRKASLPRAMAVSKISDRASR